MAFRDLLNSIGEEEMLKHCYDFMTFAIVRPSEEQRQVLEQKFEQDRRFEELRSILIGRPSFQEPLSPRSPVPSPVPSPVEVEVEVEKIQTAKTNLSKAKKYWPFMRVKNFVNGLNLTDEKRISYERGLQILAQHRNMTLEELMATSSNKWLGDNSNERLLMSKMYPYTY